MEKIGTMCDTIFLFFFWVKKSRESVILVIKGQTKL